MYAGFLLMPAFLVLSGGLRIKSAGQAATRLGYVKGVQRILVVKVDVAMISFRVMKQWSCA